MSGYATGVPQLQNAATDIMNVNDQTQATLNQLRNTIDAVSGAWRGSAADAFKNLMDRFNTDAAKLQEALVSIAEQISGATQTYVQQEEEQAAEMSNIMGRLGG
ncbi:WXG100 family type VII secretion target [Saccharothrix longispora]|uniref:WXG100 family type VII secretion target n=1 Tax=Saccharothrix longispora TaxID=33920 RepID=UPI0028FDC2F8|nr:WXG100 family type VII secretion target [Saccharothrix longispora]MDU0290688.1 WXG100 family type VII secretion target [Saccharothrix longispora]